MFTSKSNGRPPGSQDPVLSGKPFGMDQFTAVRAFLSGVDPLIACKNYLLDEESATSSEQALAKLAALMMSISEQGQTRKGITGAGNVDPNLVAADALTTAADACRKLVKTARIDRAVQQKASNEKRLAEAMALNLKLLPLRGGPKPPPQFTNNDLFRTDYERRHRTHDSLDEVELAATLEEEKSEWFASIGYHYKPVYRQHPFSQVVPMRAMDFAQTQLEKTLEPAVRSAAAKALTTLVWTVQRRPAAHDHVKAWIGGSTLDALLKADVFTLYSLMSLIKQRGKSWWRQVPKLGPMRAHRIDQWIKTVGVEGGTITESDFDTVQLRRLKEIQRSEQASGPPLPHLVAVELTPLQPWLANEALNGKEGIFRTAGPNSLNAITDVDALVVTLGKYKDKTGTLKLYAREICRFCLWCYLVKQIPLSSVSTSEAREFREFLAHIPDDWISTAEDVDPRHTKGWRPFRGQLSASSQRKALTAISVVFKQLNSAHYLSVEPMSSVLKHASLPTPKMEVTHSLSIKQWQLMVQVTEKIEATANLVWAKKEQRGTDPRPGIRRLKALIHILQSTGIRRDELFKARLSHIRKVNLDGEDAYLLKVTGKRAKERDVLLHKHVRVLIMEHLKDRSGFFNDDMSSNEGKLEIPLISVLASPIMAHQLQRLTDISAGSQKSKIILEQRPLASSTGALSSGAMLASLRTFFAQCAAETTDDPDEKESFTKATTHWMRHTFGHSMVDADVDLRVVQMAMGHTNINTTAQYAKTNQNQLIRGMRSGYAAISQVKISTTNNTALPQLVDDSEHLNKSS